MAREPRPPRPPKPEGVARNIRMTGKNRSQIPDTPVEILPDGRRTMQNTFLYAPYGAWTYSTENERQVIEGLAHDTDRAAAIIAGSIVDVRLTAAIRHRFRRDVKIEGELFRSSGALGSFNAKIDIAYLMGIFSRAAHADAHLIRDIRNSFAHDLSIKDFKSASIRDRSMNLKLIETHAKQTVAGAPNQLFFNLSPGAIPRLGVVGLAEKKRNPRDRYILSCSLLASSLSHAEIMTREELI